MDPLGLLAGLPVCNMEMHDASVGLGFLVGTGFCPRNVLNSLSLAWVFSVMVKGLGMESSRMMIVVGFPMAKC